MRNKLLFTNSLENISREIFNTKNKKSMVALIGNQPGIYALYKDNKLCYIGKASKNVVKRVEQHLKDRLRTSWNKFSVYCTQTASHLQYIEGIMIAINQPKENTQKPNIGNRNTEKELLELCKKELYKTILGSKPAKLSSKTKRTQKTPTLYSRLRGRKLLKGSYKNTTYRARLLKSGVRFNKTTYSSPTAAAVAITGNSVSGLAFWSAKNPKNNQWVKLAKLAA